MAPHNISIEFKSVRSRTNKTFLYFLGSILAAWVIYILYIIIVLVIHLVKQTPLEGRFSETILFLVGSFLMLFALIRISLKKERFYTHLIINEEGLIYFDRYSFRTTKIIPWGQISESPIKRSKNTRDVTLEHLFTGSTRILFWYNRNTHLKPVKEDFGGFGPIPFVFSNQKELVNAFVTGLLHFRKDLCIDPKLIRKVYMGD